MIKLFFIIAFSSCFLQARSQSWQRDSCSGFSLDLNIENGISDTVALEYRDCEESNWGNGILVLTNGSYHLIGQVNRATEAILFTDIKDKNMGGPKVLRFIIQPGKQEINISMEDGKISSVFSAGAPAETEKSTWDKSVKSIEEREESLLEEASRLRKKLDPSPRDSILINPQLQKVYNEIARGRQEKKKEAIEYALQNPQSYFSGLIINRYRTTIPLDSAVKLFNHLSAPVRQSDFGKFFLEEMTKLSTDTNFLKTYLAKQQYQKLKEIHTVYDIPLETFQGQSLDLSQFQGKYILFDTWANWCGYCHKNVPSMKRIIMRYQKKNIVFISVSTDDSINVWKAAAKKYGYPGINLWDQDKQFGRFFKVKGLPRFILIGPSGEVINEDAPQPIDPGLKVLLDSLLAKKGNVN